MSKTPVCRNPRSETRRLMVDTLRPVQQREDSGNTEVNIQSDQCPERILTILLCVLPFFFVTWPRSFSQGTYQWYCYMCSPEKEVRGRQLPSVCPVRVPRPSSVPRSTLSRHCFVHLNKAWLQFTNPCLFWLWEPGPTTSLHEHRNPTTSRLRSGEVLEVRGGGKTELGSGDAIVTRKVIHDLFE